MAEDLGSIVGPSFPNGRHPSLLNWELSKAQICNCGENYIGGLKKTAQTR